MRHLDDELTLSEHRVTAPSGRHGAHHYRLPTNEQGVFIWCAAAVGLGWEYVGVCRELYGRDGTRLSLDLPHFSDLDRVKSLFWRRDEAALVLFPPEGVHIELHPAVVHLWRRQQGDIAWPPRSLAISAIGGFEVPEGEGCRWARGDEP